MSHRAPHTDFEKEQLTSKVVVVVVVDVVVFYITYHRLV